MVITENMVWKRIVNVLSGGLTAMGISGFKVIQHSQANDIHDDAAVLVARVNMHRYGWTATHYRKDHPSDKLMFEHIDWIDEATFQVSGYRPRTNKDDEKTITAYDAISLLSVFINSQRGVEAFCKQGMHPYRVNDITNGPTTSDSAQYEFNPSFDLTLVIPQSVRFDVPVIEVVKIADITGDKEITDKDAKRFVKDGKIGIYDATGEFVDNTEAQEMKG